MNTYLPLLVVLVTIWGGAMAGHAITPAPALVAVTVGRVSGNDGRPFGLWEPVTTPPGVLLTRTESSDIAMRVPDYTERRLRPRPARPGLPQQRLRRLAPGPPRLFVAEPWPIPAAVYFAPQTPTPTTGEQAAIAS